ncbi:MAG: glycosyltransferase family 4 protein, partial [Candidatus Moraniibacteriota bacterium]
MLNKRDKELRIVMSNYDDKRNPWYAGGGAIVVHEVARRLAKTYSVEVITGSYPGSKKREVIDGVCYQRVGFSFFGPWIGQLSYWILLPFYSVFRTFDVWIESFVPPFGVSILPWITSKPVIGLIHMLPGMDMWRKYRLPFFLFERMGLRWYDRFIVLSDSMGKAIQKYNKRAKIHVIPNGVDMPNLGKKREKEHLL